MKSHKNLFPQVMALIQRILDTHEDGRRKEWGGDLFDCRVRRYGLPIANLTSQFFANIHLDGFDHFLKQEMGVKGYVCYVDDFLIFAESREQARAWGRQAKHYLAKLHLEVHPDKYRLCRTDREGADFCGIPREEKSPARRAQARGGAFNNNENNLRSSNRNNNDPSNENNNVGFRVARPLRATVFPTARSWRWVSRRHAVPGSGTSGMSRAAGREPAGRIQNVPEAAGSLRLRVKAVSGACGDPHVCQSVTGCDYPPEELGIFRLRAECPGHVARACCPTPEKLRSFSGGLASQSSSSAR
jgi:hypothetical protein